MSGLGVPQLVVVAVMALPVWGIIDAATRPGTAWAATGQSRALWIVMQLLFWSLGTAVYLIAIRPALRRAAA